MLLPLSNMPRDYAWGSTTLIAGLEGREPDGRPEAEVWYGDHPACPARVDDGSGRTLDAVLADAGAPALPYLLKVLATSTSLSIQAHPSRAQAAEGFAREEAAGIPRDAAERTYRDDNHKPEILVALSEVFRALVGLRPLAQTRRLVAVLGEGQGPAALTARLAGADEAAALRATLSWVLSGEAQAEVDDIVAALRTASSDEFAAELSVLRRIAAQFPGDAGIVVALLMNLVELRRGEALFAPAGVLHAYQDGLGVELMAASDNVLRGGLTPKHIDVAELLSIVDTTPGPAPRVAPRPVDGADLFDPGVPDFALRRVVIVAGQSRRVALAGPTILLVTAGAITLSARTVSIALAPGAAAFAEGEAAVEITGSGEVFLAQPGGDAAR